MDTESLNDESDNVALLSDESTSIPKNVYRISHSPGRWILAIVISLLNFSNGWAFMSYTGVEAFLVRNYSANIIFVKCLTQVFFMATFVLIFPAIYLIDKKGLRFPTLIVSVVQALGTSFKILASCNFNNGAGKYLLFVGQLLFAVVCPIILVLPTKVASTCFQVRERALANSVCTMGNFFGVMLVLLIHPAAYKRFNLMIALELISAVPVYVGSLSSFIFLKKEFAKPIRVIKEDFILMFMKLIKNKQFCILSATFGTLLGVFNTILLNYSMIMRYQTYSQIDNNNAISAMIGVGAFVSVIASKIFDKYRNGATIAKIALMITCLLLSMNYLIGVFETYLINTVLLGCINSSILFLLLPYFLSTGVKITYPIPEAASSGFQWFMGQIISLVIAAPVTLVTSLKFFDEGIFFQLTIILTPLLIICHIFVCHYKEDS